MKRNLIITTVIVLALAAAFHLGMLSGRTQIASQNVSFNAVFTTDLLNSFHAGDTNRVASGLNNFLDQNVFAIGTWCDVPFSRPYRERMSGALSHAAAYRANHPRTPLQAMPYDADSDSDNWHKVVKKQELFAKEFNETVDRLLREAQPLSNEKQPLPKTD